jgi:hypothetical protein
LTLTKDALRERVRARVPGWRDKWPAVRTAGASTLYGFLATLTVWPVVEALISGEASSAAAVFAALGIASGLGSNLVANLIEKWAQGGDEVQAADELAHLAAERAEVHDVLDRLMEEMQTVAVAQRDLGAADREWFLVTLRDELRELKRSLPASLRPLEADLLLRACRAQVERKLESESHKYVGSRRVDGGDGGLRGEDNLYVHRALERDVKAFLDVPFDPDAPHCFVIVEPAGSGKTNLLCEMARARVARAPAVLLLGRQVSLQPPTRLLYDVQYELQTDSDQIQTESPEMMLLQLDRLADELGCCATVFLDAINEHRDRRAMGVVADK